MGERMQRILKENAEFEEKAPYNFCDRWCQRCTHDKQTRCRLYLDEFERKITCIAYGKDENDSKITEAVMEAQCRQADDMLNEHIEKFGIDLDNPDIDEKWLSEEDAVDFEDLPPDIQKHIRFVENNPLDNTAKQYHKKAHSFLENTFYKDESARPDLKYDFESVSWYHTLLGVKLHRALCGFHEPATDGDISLCDAVTQFDICKKAARESIQSLRKIKKHFPAYHIQTVELIALLNNIYSRIEMLVETI